MSQETDTSLFKDFPAIHESLDRLEAVIPFAAVRVESISAWSVGQHVEHILSATSILAVMLMRNRTSDGTAEQRSIKTLLLERGSIPRGVAQAPQGTVPGDDQQPEDLERLLRSCRNRAARLDSVHPDSVVLHPYLGEMSRDEALSFMRIHLNHHLSIIADIVKASE